MRNTTPTPPPLADVDDATTAPVSVAPAVRHARGRIAPPLAADSPLWRRAWRGLHRLGHGLVLHDVLLSAPAMAFHFFLSLMPLLVFVGYVVGFIARRRGVNAVLSPLLDNLPGTAEAVVRKEVERLAGGGSVSLGPVAAASFIWIASGGTHGLINAVENVVGAPKRPWWKKRLLAMAWVATSLAAVAIAALAIVKWDAVMHPPPPHSSISTAPGQTIGALPQPILAHGSTPGLASSSSVTPLLSTDRNATTAKSATSPRRHARIVRSSGEHALALSLSVLFATAALASFYRLAVKHSKRVERRVLPGAVVAVVLWIFISWVFGVYVGSLAEYAVFYGSLAAVAVLLVWLWLTSLAILVGAELNAQLEGLRD